MCEYLKERGFEMQSHIYYLVSTELCIFLQSEILEEMWS